MRIMTSHVLKGDSLQEIAERRLYAAICVTSLLKTIESPILNDLINVDIYHA